MTDHEYHEALDASAPAETDEDIARAKRILQGLGFCGHYMHFHGGGRSGQVPILCMLDRCGGRLSQQELGSRFEIKPGSLSEDPIQNGVCEAH